MTWRESTIYIGAQFLYFNYRSNTYIGKYLLQRKRNPFRKQQSTQIKKLSDTVVRGEDDEM